MTAFSVCFLILIALICLAGACAALRKEGMKPAGMAAFLPLCLLLGAFAAHLGYCLCRFPYAWYDMAPDRFHGFAFLTFWDGNYMLYGGWIGVLAALAIACGIGGVKLLPAMDAAAPWGALMIAGTRVFQGMMGSFYGAELDEELEGSFLERLPFSLYDDYYEVWHWALFVLAALWAVLLFICLLKKTDRAPGDRALLLTGLYAAAQIILETLRRDEVLRWGFVRCSQLFSAVLVLFVLICYCVRARKGHTRRKWLSFLLFFAAAGVCFLMEFAAEQRLRWLLFLSTRACYTVSAFGCLLMVFSVLLMRSAEKPETIPAKG